MCLPLIVIGTSCDAVCFMCGLGFSSFWFWFHRTSYKDVLYALVNGRRCIGQCLFTGCFKQCIWVFLSKIQKPHTTSVGLLFHAFGVSIALTTVYVFMPIRSANLRKWSPFHSRYFWWCSGICSVMVLYCPGRPFRRWWEAMRLWL